MKFTLAMMTFLLWFTLATTTHAQSNLEGTSVEIENSTAYTMADTEKVHARIFTVYTDAENTVLNVTFELQEASHGSIELVCLADGVGQILDEQVFGKGMHNREYFITHLEEGKYYCVIRAGNWTGVHKFTVEDKVPEASPVLF